MVQDPAPVIVTVVVAIVQLPLALKLTARPDEAVALTEKLGSPYDLFGNAPNVTVWLAFATVRLFVPLLLA